MVIYIMYALVLNSISLHKKFEMRIVSTTPMISYEAQKWQMCHVILTKPPSGMICRLKANTRYSLPVYKIWEPYSVSHSGDIIGHLKWVAWPWTRPFSCFLIHVLGPAAINLPVKLDLSISTSYRDNEGDTECKNGVVWGYFLVSQGHWKYRHSIECLLALDTAHLCAKFDNFSFSRCRDIIGASKNSMDYVTTYPRSSKGWFQVVCRWWSRTCFGQPNYQMWHLD